jgi:hypothetical protein
MPFFLKIILASITVLFPIILYPYLVLNYLKKIQKQASFKEFIKEKGKEKGVVALGILSSFAGFTTGHVLSWMFGFFDPIDVLIGLRFVTTIFSFIPIILLILDLRKLKDRS